MSIRTKLALILFVVVGAFLALDFTLLRVSGVSSFAALEKSRCESQMSGIADAFDATYDELAALARTPASDATVSAGAHLAVSINQKGQILDYMHVDLDGDPAILREVPTEAISLSHPFMKSWLTGTPPRGLFDTTKGLMLVSSADDQAGGQPLLHVRGRWLSAEALAAMQAIAGATFQCRSIQELESADEEVAIPALDETTVTEEGDRILRASTLVNDVRGLPVGVVESPVLRNDTETMDRVRRQEILTALCIAIIFPLILLVLMQVVVTGPLGRLTAHALSIGEADDAARRLNLKRTDEIGALASEFDRMLDKLEVSRRAQQKAARMSGRSDVATDVMHSVGNLVNSVNVAACVASDSVSKLDLSDLRAIQRALVDHQGSLDAYLRDDPQGAHLLSFLEASLQSLDVQVQTAGSEVTAVLGSVDEVASLVQSLRKEESSASVVESVVVAEEVRAALQRVGAPSDVAAQTHLDLDETLCARLDRQRLEEILDALMLNAHEALASVPVERRNVFVRLARLDGGVRLSIEDTGVGIEQERLSEIFAMSTTTKGKGRGRGLHMASIIAKELGGELSAWSAGPGEGALFTLDLPTAGAVAA